MVKTFFHRSWTGLSLSHQSIQFTTHVLLIVLILNFDKTYRKIISYSIITKVMQLSLTVHEVTSWHLWVDCVNSDILPLNVINRVCVQILIHMEKKNLVSGTASYTCLSAVCVIVRTIKHVPCLYLLDSNRSNI